MRYLIIIMSILVILFIYLNNIEKFNVKRKRKGKKIQLGFLNNTPAPIKKLMTSLNKIGNQMEADTEYDTVETDYLDKDKIP